MPSLALALGAVLLAAAPTLARTDLTGCTYYDSVVAPSHQAPYATRIWYVPDTGELCDFLDCGGGRAPPKTTVPGCPLYDGTATYSPSFIDPKTLGRAGAPATVTTTTAAARTASAATTTEGRTTAAPSVAGTASGSGAESTTGGASAATEPAESAGSSRSGASPASPSSSTAGGDRAATTTGTTTTPTGAAAGLPTAAAVLGPCLLAGVAAGMGLL